MKQSARLLIVVPCLNEEATLAELLNWLITGAGDHSLIVVADGGSTDNSLTIAEDFVRQFPSVRLLHNAKRLQSAGVNLAARTFGADREWLIRIDAHCSYPVGYIGLLLDAAARHSATSVVVPMITHGTSCFQRAAAAAQNSVMGTGGSPHRHLGTGRYVDHGHHALFDLAAFMREDGYDESFSHNEDAELDQRLVSAGARIWLEPSASLVYQPRGTPGRLFRQYLNYGRGRARTVKKHRLKLKLRQAVPLVIAPCLMLVLAGAVLAFTNVWWMILLLPALGWFGVCQLYALVLAVRARSPCVLASGVAAMIMHAGWSLGYWSRLLSRRELFVK